MSLMIFSKMANRQRIKTVRLIFIIPYLLKFVLFIKNNFLESSSSIDEFDLDETEVDLIIFVL